MIRLTLTLNTLKCRHDDCNSPAGMFGVCRAHEQAAVAGAFWKVAHSGLATANEPGCFRSHEEWRQYIVASAISGGYVSRGNASPINYCKDCTPAYKREMMEQGRCLHPETVFVREQGSGDTVGVSVTDKRSSHVWEQAVMGMSGSVVAMPPQQAVGEMLDALSQKNPVGRPPKKRGRPSKSEKGARP